MRQKLDNLVAFFIWVILICIPLQGLINTKLIQIFGVLALFFIIIQILHTKQIRKLDFSDILALMFAEWGITSFFWTENVQASLSLIITQIQLIIFLFLLRSTINDMERILFFTKGYVIGALILALNIIMNAFLHGIIPGIRYTVGNMNAGFVGNVLSLGVSPSMLLLMGAHHRLERLLGGFYLPIGIVAIILTGTRTSAVSALINLFIFVIISFKTKMCHRKTILFVASLSSVIIIWIIFAYFPNLTGVTRLKKITEAIISRQFTNREDIWPIAINTFFKYPLSGIGIGSFSSVTEDVFGYRIVAHNTWLSVAAELGIVGLIIFSLMTIYLFFCPIQTDGLIRIFGLTLVISWFINASMGTDTYIKTTWMVYGLISALPKINERRNVNE